MLLFSQGCLDLDVSGNIITIKQKLRKYFPDENIATDQMTILYITILTEDLLNGVYRTIIYITILTEDSRNGVHRTIIYITILTEG
jgi:hypothetical protein